MASSYFSHDSNARNSTELVQIRMEHGNEGYAIFFMILERLRDETDYTSVTDYNAIAFDLRTSSKIVKSVVEDFGLFAFTNDGKRFYSESFCDRMKIKDEKSKKRSEAGKKGAESRWRGDKNGNAMAMPKETIARKVKESKVKEARRARGDKKIKSLVESFMADMEFALDFNATMAVLDGLDEATPPARFVSEQKLAAYFKEHTGRGASRIRSEIAFLRLLKRDAHLFTTEIPKPPPPPCTNPKCENGIVFAEDEAFPCPDCNPKTNSKGLK